MIDRKPFSRPAKARHHLVGDHQDSVLIAQLPYSLEISIWWNKNSIRPSNRLENESGNRVRPLQLNGLFEHRKRRVRRLPSSLNAMVRVEHVHHARKSRLNRPSPWIPRKADRSRRRSVIRTVPGDDLMA